MVESFGLLAGSISATAAYLIALREFYSWWTVAPVTLLALPIAMILAVMLMELAGTLVGRMICLALGGMLVWAAATHDQRSGSACMGIALLILGVTARKTK